MAELPETSKGKVAVLYYGQPRLQDETNFSLRSIKDYLKGYDVDIYMHTWNVRPGESYHHSCWAFHHIKPALSIDKVIKMFNPLSFLVEIQKIFDPPTYLHPDTLLVDTVPRDVPNMISQIYSVISACNLIDNPRQYSRFILTRPDAVLDHWDIPPLDELNPEKLYFIQDFLNIFGLNSLLILKNHLQTLREIPVRESWVSAEVLRYYILDHFGIIRVPLRHGDCTISRDLRSRDGDLFLVIGENDVSKHWLTSSGVAINYKEGTFVCRFKPKSRSEDYQWVGFYIKEARTTVTCKIKFVKIPETLKKRVYAKTHNPDMLYNVSSVDYSGWKSLEFKDLSPVSNPIIPLFLDDYCNEQEEVIVLISDLKWEHRDTS